MIAKNGDEARHLDGVVNRMIGNQVRTLSRFMQRFFDPRRDINKECGFPKTEEISTTLLKEMYLRNPYANRVVGLYPSECWKITPAIFEDEDVNVTTAFEERWNSLPKLLNLEGESYFDEEEGNPIWEYLERVQRMAGIGHYGVLFLGVNDGAPLNEPVRGSLITTPSLSGELVGNLDSDNQLHDLKYMRVFDETCAKITQWDLNKNSPRYQHPVMYQLTLQDMSTSTDNRIVGRSTVDVHWTRVLHITVNNESSELFGIPEQIGVWNNLLSLDKVTGGSGEMFFKGAFMGLALKLASGMDPAEAADEEEVTAAITKYQNTLQKFLAIPGWDIQQIAPQVSDPINHVDVQVGAICIKKKVPKRVFMGSEVGQLASGQDSESWDDRIWGVRHNYCTPRLLMPFANRLINIRVLPKPKQGLRATWPKETKISGVDRSRLARTFAVCLDSYVNDGLDNLMEFEDYLITVMGVPEKRAAALAKKQKVLYNEEEARMEEAQRMAEELMKQQPTVPVAGQPPANGKPQPPMAGKPNGK